MRCASTSVARQPCRFSVVDVWNDDALCRRQATSAGTLRRLASFASSPLDRDATVSCVRLANRGFVYAGQSDRLLCQRCGVEVGGWLDTRRDPAVEHRCCRGAGAADPSLVRVCRDVRLRSCAIYAVYVDVLRRAARTGVLPPPAAGSRDLEPRDPPGHAPSTQALPTDDCVTPGSPSDDADIPTLRLSLSRRPHTAACNHYCACYYWSRQWRQSFPF